MTPTLCELALSLNFADAFAAIAFDVFGEFDEAEYILL